MKRMKKLASIVLALVMVFAMAIPAMAADITIKNTETGHTYKAYQVLTGDITGTGQEEDPYVIANAKWGTGVSETYKSAHPDLEKFLDDLALADTASDLANELVENEGYLGVVAASADETPYVIEGLTPGYYLIVDESSEGLLSAYIVEVVTDSFEVNPKTGKPEFEKKVQDVNDSTGEKTGLQDSADYDIGDDVPFTLIATIPEGYANFETYYLAFTDNLSDGLKRNDDLKVTVGTVDKETGEVTGTDITGQFMLTPGTPDEDDFTLVCENLKAVAAVTPGSKIIVTYTAGVLDTAVVGGAGNPNTAHLTYSRDPNNFGEGKKTTDTPDDKVVVFTYKLGINKKNEANENLKGAEFTLEKYDAVTKNWVKKEKVDITDGYKFEFKGLDDGYYRLTETKTPPGYNTMDPVYFEVAAKHDEESNDPKLTELTLTQVGEGEGESVVGDPLSGEAVTFDADSTLEDGTFEADVINYSGTTLPETGGIGTTIFYVVGTILVIGAVVLLVTKKRMTKEQ